MSDSVIHIKIRSDWHARHKRDGPHVGCGNGIIVGDRLVEGHVGVRFGDRRHSKNDPNLTIRLDGVDVTDEANEAVPGDPGVVILVNPDPIVSKAHNPWVMVFGLVSVELILEMERERWPLKSG